jgi:uncharacterized Zn-finger protein
MQAYNSAGRHVSLLNDEQMAYSYPEPPAPPQRLSYAAANSIISQAYNPIYGRSASSSPNTPELIRSDSYDSNRSNDALSPMTPADNLYDTALATSKRPSNFAGSRSPSYEEEAADASPNGLVPVDRATKRYPCRYRDSHGCEKTFTTSGHASRHSKIHTAEKAVHCTFAGCSKKFTRADNMKQHLETHFKDKSSRSSTSSASSRPSLSSGDRRSSSSSKLSTRHHHHSHHHHKHTAAAAATSPLPSPITPGGAFDMRPLNLPLLSRPSAVRTPSSGLDALAMIACQEGSA